ncbi:MAG TPA: DNA methyltransferase [Planctomycetota bacterium]
MISPGGRRRSLSNVGGRAGRTGDPALSEALARCLDVDPRSPLPFTHGFHPWPARMHPDTARRAIDAFPGTRVLDPFVGSGTTALEAVRSGRPFTGVDVSRVAIEVAWTRTRILPPEACRSVEREAARIAAQAAKIVHRSMPLPPWAERDRAWYPPHTLKEIVLLLELIRESRDPVIGRILRAVLSSVVVKISRQVSDSVPVADREFRAWRPGTAFRFFRERGVELTGMLLRLSSDLYKRKVAFVEPDLKLADARKVELAGPFDLVLSSPPYPGVYDYARHHRLRYPLFGEDGSFAERHEIGARRDPAEYANDLANSLRRIPLAPGGRMILLVGEGTIEGKRVRTDEVLRGLPEFHVLAAASQERPGDRREHLVLLTR